MVAPVICAIGEVNLDLRFVIPRLPKTGETLTSHDSDVFLGGKAANCSVAIARLEVPIALVGCIGDDPQGDFLMHELEKENFTELSIIRKPQSSGNACILVMGEENRIIVSPSPISAMTIEDSNIIESYFNSVQYVFVQPVIPPIVARHLSSKFKSAGVRLILEVGPLPQDVEWLYEWERPYIITPNLTEAEQLLNSRIDSDSDAMNACHKLLTVADNVVLKMGNRGAILATRETIEHFPAKKVEVVDSAGAGDAFNGGMLVALASNRPIEEAVEYGCACGAFSVGRAGTSTSMPFRTDVPLQGDK